MSIETEYRSLFPETPFDRRRFMSTSVGVGFAAAVQPVIAQTMITTDTQGLVAGVVSIGDSRTPAYRAKPVGSGPFPLVIVVSEIFGVHEHIADVCRRLAKVGYYAIAPEFFVRQGDVKTGEMSKVMAVVAQVPDTQVLADCDAAMAFAGVDGGDQARSAITGFCWGGRIVWLYSAQNPRVKAGVAWYGRLTDSFNAALNPTTALSIAAKVRAPVLGLYGGQDQGIPQDGIVKMKAALAAPDASPAAKKSEFVVYPEAGHAFNADYRPSYVKTAADDGWKRMLAWFKVNGV
ncbi:dienelactone hydrolase family protein [soil metagenome]